MNNRKITILTERVEREFLPFVRRPARYIAGEVNQVKKDLSSCDLRAALCFPDVYEVGMSHTGLAIIYDILNRLETIAAERVFAPWIDAEKILRQKSIELFSLESKASLKSFDVIGFSLTNELCYTNVLNMLDLAGLKLKSSDRNEDDPLIVGGGGMANCCEPVADFFDLFILGEGEEAVVALANLLREEKEHNSPKKTILEKAARKFKWIYVPQFYEFDSNNKIKARLPGLPCRFENAVVEDFDNAPVPLSPIVPFAQAVHERVSIEIMRGCPGRCRFCQASFCRRPIRCRSIEKILEAAKKCHSATGFDTVSLLSLSTGDYPDLEKLVELMHNYFKEKKVGLSLPSLRVDQQLKLLPKLAASVRKSGLTIAVEAASENLRQIINKPLKDEDLFAGVEAAWRAGWGKIKLYFMAGLPGETQDDIKQIVTLCYELAKLRKKTDGKTRLASPSVKRAGQINAAISWFVPKPHTPFGWLGQKSKSYFENAKKLILDEKKKLRAKFLHFKFHDIGNSLLESAIGRGDRQTGNVIENAFKNGARFDLWDECFDYELWEKAFAACGLELQSRAQKQFATDEILPWQHLGGPDKDYLLGHLKDAMEKQKPPQ